MENCSKEEFVIRDSETKAVRGAFDTWDEAAAVVNSILDFNESEYGQRENFDAYTISRELKITKDNIELRGEKGCDRLWEIVILHPNKVNTWITLAYGGNSTKVHAQCYPERAKELRDGIYKLYNDVLDGTKTVIYEDGDVHVKKW